MIYKPLLASKFSNKKKSGQPTRLELSLASITFVYQVSIPRPVKKARPAKGQSEMRSTSKFPHPDARKSHAVVVAKTSMAVSMKRIHHTEGVEPEKTHVVPRERTKCPYPYGIL
jgi:hypothetical protein